MRALDLAALAAAFCVSAWTAARLSGTAFGSRFLDEPNERSLHEVPVPRTGGLAILAGLAAGAAVLAVAGRWVSAGAAEFAWLGAAVLALSAISFLDDSRGVSPAIRLVVQLAACAAAVFGLGLALDRLHAPFLGEIRMGALALPLTIVGLAWFVNLYNFMDGMDGLAGCMAVIGCGFLAIGAGRVGDAPLAFASLVVSAAAAGFLLSNLPPARIFLGDVGSITLGFLCGALSLAAIRRGDGDVWFPVLVFLPFLFDSGFTLARRISRRERPWKAHREHLYQRVVLAGWSRRKTLSCAAAAMVVSGALGLWRQTLSGSGRDVILVVGLVLFAGIAAAARNLERRPKMAGSDRS